MISVNTIVYIECSAWTFGILRPRHTICHTTHTHTHTHTHTYSQSLSSCSLFLAVWSVRYREEGREREGGRLTGGEERWEKCEEENKVTEEKRNGRGYVFCCLATSIVPSGGCCNFTAKTRLHRVRCKWFPHTHTHTHTHTQYLCR